MSNELVDWDEHVERVCHACRGSDLVTDLCAGDVVCRDCGTCVRERLLVDDSEMRLDDEGGEETTMRRRGAKRPAAGLDDRHKQKSSRRGMDFDLAAAEIEEAVLASSGLAYAAEDSSHELHAVAKAAQGGDYARSRFLDDAGEDGDDPAKPRGRTNVGFAELHARSNKHLALRARTRGCLEALCERIHAPEEVILAAEQVADQVPIAVLEEIAAAARRKTLKANSQKQQPGGAKGGGPLLLDPHAAHAVALVYWAAKRSAVAVGLRELAVASNLAPQAVAAAFRALDKHLLVGGEGKKEAPSGGAAVVDEEAQDQAPQEREEAEEKEASRARNSDFVRRTAARLKATRGAGAVGAERTPTKRLVAEAERCTAAAVVEAAACFADADATRQVLDARDPAVAAAACLFITARAKFGARASLLDGLASAAFVTKSAIANAVRALDDADVTPARRAKRQPAGPPRQPQPTTPSPLSITTPFEAPQPPTPPAAAAKNKKSFQGRPTGLDDGPCDDADLDFFQMPTRELPPPPLV